MTKNKKEKNFLEYTPVISEKIHWMENENGIVQLQVCRKSFIEKVAIKLFFAPDKFIIDLDNIGSYIWKNVDGKRNIYEISLLLKEKFGEDIEPLYDRFVEYMSILKNNKFIEYKMQ